MTRPTVPPRHRLPHGLIGLLVIVVILELSLFRRDRFTNGQVESWKFKGLWAKEKSAGADVLIFGDSMMEFGVIPSAIRDRRGLPAINLATHNGGAALSCVLLRRTLVSGSKPRAILVDFMPHQLAKKADDPTFASSWAAMLSTAETLKLAASGRDPAFLVRTLTHRALRCLASRHEVRSAILAALRGGAFSNQGHAKVLRRHWTINLGAQVAVRDPNRGPDHFDGLFPDAWRIEPETERHIRAFLDLAEASEIPVYWTIPPLSPGLQAWRDARKLDDPYLGFVESLLDGHPRLTVLDARKSGYKDDLFLDEVHLNRDGAEAFTRTLADAIASNTSTTRIVRLDPPQANRVRTLGVEDLGETRLALQHRGSNPRRR